MATVVLPSDGTAEVTTTIFGGLSPLQSTKLSCNPRTASANEDDGLVTTLSATLFAPFVKRVISGSAANTGNDRVRSTCSRVRNPDSNECDNMASNSPRNRPPGIAAPKNMILFGKLGELGVVAREITRASGAWTASLPSISLKRFRNAS